MLWIFQLVKEQVGRVLMSEKAFASQGDLQAKQVTFSRLSDNAYAYTAEGDPNTGVVIGDDAVMIIDATATPVMAQDVIRHVRRITDKPIRYVTLTHYHAVRVLGASGYRTEGLQHIIASQDTRELIVERGQQDMDSEIGRFPRLFQAVESIPGLTWPTLTFRGEMTLWLGQLEVRLMQLGRGHTKGDIVVVAAAAEDPVLRRPRRGRVGVLRRRCVSGGLAAHARRASLRSSPRSSCPAAGRRC